MNRGGATLKILGWVLMAGLPGAFLLFAGYVYVTGSPGDRTSMISYAGLITGVILASALPGVLLLLLGYAFTGTKTEGKLGKPHS